MKKKINVTLEDSLVQKLDEAAERLCLSRSGVISVSLSEYFDKQEVLRNWPEFVEAMQKFGEAVERS